MPIEKVAVTPSVMRDYRCVYTTAGETLQFDVRAVSIESAMIKIRNSLSGCKTSYTVNSIQLVQE